MTCGETSGVENLGSLCAPRVVILLVSGPVLRRTIIAGAQAHLLSGGLLALETDGGRQAHLIADVLKSSRDEGDRPAFRDVKVTRDYSWIDRFVTAIRT